MKKYFYKVTDENGHIIFNHSSDYAYKLLKMVRKESHDSAGNMLYSWYFGTAEHNIPEYIIEEIAYGAKI